MHRSDLCDANAFLIAAEQARLDSGDALGAYFDARREKQISLGPTACEEGFGRTPRGRGYTHSSAPFPQTQMNPTIRMTRKTSISKSPNVPSALNLTAQGKRKIVSTSNTTKRIAMM